MENRTDEFLKLKIINNENKESFNKGYKEGKSFQYYEDLDLFDCLINDIIDTVLDSLNLNWKLTGNDKIRIRNIISVNLDKHKKLMSKI